MAWETAEWACGHTGSIQLYGPGAGRRSRIAWEAGRDCMACWLIGQWEASGDPRGAREDKFSLAQDIARGKGKRINTPEPIAATEQYNEEVKND